jgi:hypothetical protein
MVHEASYFETESQLSSSLCWSGCLCSLRETDRQRNSLNHQYDRQSPESLQWSLMTLVSVSSSWSYSYTFMHHHEHTKQSVKSRRLSSVTDEPWNTRVWLSLMHDTRAWLTMTSLLSLNVKSFKCRKSVQSFNLEVFARTSTFTDSHRLCRTPKTKKQIFYKFVRSFPSFCWTCSFPVHVLFLRHWGWYQMTKRKKLVGSASDS